MALINRVNQCAPAFYDEITSEQIKIAAGALINRIGAGEENYGLVRRDNILGKVEVGEHAFIAVSSIETNLLLSRVFIVFLCRVEDSVERSGIVAVQVFVNSKNIIGDGFEFCIVANGEGNCLQGRLGHGGPRDVLDTTEAVGRSAIERRLRVLIREHIGWFVPGSSQNEPFVAG